MYNYCICPNGYYNPYVSAIVTIESEADRMCGQKNRSSENFTVPSSGNYSVSVSAGVDRFSIWEEDVTLLIDKPIFEYPEQKSATVYLVKDRGYYIGNPTAQEDFKVTLTQLGGAF